VPFHVPDCPFVLFQVPDIVVPAAFMSPVYTSVDPSLSAKENVMLRMLTVPMSGCPCDVVPSMPFPDCVNVKRNGPCCPAVPAVVRIMFQLPEMLTEGDASTIACHVPERPLVFVHVPDMVNPSPLITPV